MAYRNPFRDAQVTPERIDQGVDYGGTGPIYALGAGRIVSVRNGGWPGGAFITERLTEGPFAGKYVYAAENIAPSVSIGQKVDSSTRIGTITGGIETGWAAGPPNLGESLARLSGQWNSGDPSTAYGVSYSNLVESLGGPAGVQDTATSGTVPGGFQQSTFGPTTVPKQYQPLLKAASKVSGVPLPVVAAQINYESGFQPNATSGAGAQGIAQFEPGTWKTWGKGSPFNPVAAMIAYGKFMGSLMHQFHGDTRDALAAYNAGPGNISAGFGYADHILGIAGADSGGVGTVPGGLGGGGGQGGGGSSWITGILHDDQRLLGLAGQGVSNITSGGPLGDIANGIAEVSHVLAHVTAIIDWFVVPSHWVRIFSGIVGGVMVLMGSWALTHVGGDLPLAGPVTQGASLPIGMALVGVGAILLFLAFHNLPSSVSDFPSMLGYLNQAIHGQVPAAGEGNAGNLAQFLSAGSTP